MTKLETEQETRLREQWERMVEEDPLTAYDAGPPNWMVLEEWKGEKVEAFTTAAERLKGRFFPKGRQGAVENMVRNKIMSEYGKQLAAKKGWDYLWVEGTSEIGPTVTATARNCDICGRSVTGKARYCSVKCRKRASRRVP